MATVQYTMKDGTWRPGILQQTQIVGRQHGIYVRMNTLVGIIENGRTDITIDGICIK